MLELSLACSLVGSTAWTVLASSSSDTMEVEPQDWVPESCGAIPGAYQEAQKKGVAARRCSMPTPRIFRRGRQATTGSEGKIWRVQESPGCERSP